MAAGRSAPATESRDVRPRPDLRVVVLGGVAWVSAVAALRGPLALIVLAAVVAGVLLLWRRRRGHETATQLTWVVTGVGVAGLTLLRATAIAQSPVGVLAREHAVVQVRLVTTSDPVRQTGPLRRLRGPPCPHRDRARSSRAPPGPGPGAADRRRAVETHRSRFDRAAHRPAATRHDLGPGRRREPTRATRGRRAARRAAPRRRGAAVLDPAGRGGHDIGPRTLVPALVDGDDAGMPTDQVDAFRVSGLTHLLAVSGTNLTLVVGSLLVLARWLGVRARGLVVVGIVGVVGFVLVARSEPSVLRAAVMGSVALVGLGADGRAKGARALGAAVLLLVLVDPWLADAPGFALSVLASAGIIWLAPGWRDRLARWTPRWVAEAISVPLAAQVACTPLVAALSGQVSLVAVVANLAAAPAVAPATVLGLAGGCRRAGLADRRAPRRRAGRMVCHLDHRRRHPRRRAAGGGRRVVCAPGGTGHAHGALRPGGAARGRPAGPPAHRRGPGPAHGRSPSWCRCPHPGGPRRAG